MSEFKSEPPTQPIVAEWLRRLRAAPTNAVMVEVERLEAGPANGLTRLKLRLARAALRLRTGEDDVRKQGWFDQGVNADWMRCTQCGQCVDQDLRCPGGHADPLGLEDDDYDRT